MAISEDVERALDFVTSAQTILEELGKEQEVRHVDPELLTSQELRAIKNRLDIPKEDLRQVDRRLAREEFKGDEK